MKMVVVIGAWLKCGLRLCQVRQLFVLVKEERDFG